MHIKDMLSRHVIYLLHALSVGLRNPSVHVLRTVAALAPSSVDLARHLHERVNMTIECISALTWELYRTRHLAEATSLSTGRHL